MADSILRLRVDSSEYDSKIKRATDGLTRYADGCRRVGGTLEVVEKETLDYVRALGRMETVSHTATGKSRELKTAFTELSVQYKELTDAEKQSPYGQALSKSLEQLKTRLTETKQRLQEVNDEMGDQKQGSQIGSTIGKGGRFDGMLQVFGGNLMTKAAMAGVGALQNLASEMTQCIAEGVELAKQGEGIRMAFERLNRPDIMDGLREATHGTVSDLELMKAAVKFNDFKLPLNELGTMLAFAQQKAKDTGQSVDYMVDSIVTGLGRKSLMILDNLGLSAAEIKEEMAKTGDMTSAVGEIIRRQMAAAGEYVSTAADRATAADVKLKNAMEDLGRTFLPLQEAGSDMWNNLKIGALDLLNSAVKPLIKYLQDVGTLRKNLNAEGTSENADMKRRLRYIQSGKNKQYWHDKNVGYYDEQIRQQAFKVAAYSDDDSYTRGLRKKAQGQLDALKQLKEDYLREEAKILNGLNKPKDVVTTTTTTTGKTTKADEILPVGSVAALTKEMQELQKQQQMATSPEGWKALHTQIDDVKNSIEAVKGNMVAMPDMKQIAPVSVAPKQEITYMDGTRKMQEQIELELKAEAVKIDEGNLHDLMRAAIQNGITGLDLDFASLQNKIAQGIDIPDEQWEKLAAEINEKLAALGIEPIKVKVQTEGVSEVSKDAKGMAREWQAAGMAISAVGSAMNSIEDPAAKVMGTIAQAIATITLGYATATTQAASAGPIAWMAFAATGLATMVSAISAIHSATGYAEGGEIKGNSFSGDNIPIMANAGEVVLTRAMQGNLASQLQNGNGGGLNIVGLVNGENILLVANRALKRMGKGELVTWKD